MHVIQERDMALPAGANARITDAVTQSNVEVASEAPVQAMTSLHESLAHAVGTVFENAVSAPPSTATGTGGSNTNAQRRHHRRVALLATLTSPRDARACFLEVLA